MTITQESSLVTFRADGVTVAYPFTLPYQDKGHIQVHLNGSTISQSDYDVSPDDSEHGGTVTFITAPVVDTEVMVFRLAPFTQEYDYPPYGPFPAESHERALDKLTMLIQQVAGMIETQLIPAYRFVGDWAPLTQYYELNMVKYDGSYYIANKTHISGSSFNTTDWNLVLPSSVDDAIAAALAAATSEAEAAVSAAAAAQSAIDAQTSVDPNRKIVGISPINVELNSGSDELEVSFVGAEANIVPVGSVIMWTMDIPPLGYLECSGADVSRTTYSELFLVIGESYGPGDGATTFHLPDYRGQFMRGWDNGAGIDPGKDARLDRGDGTLGDKVGTRQGDENKLHGHTTDAKGGHGHSFSMRAGGATSGTTSVKSEGPSGFQSTKNTSWESNHAHGVSGSGGDESRPKNVNILYCIKH